MSIVEAQHPIQVTANSGTRSRLDKRGGAAWHVENRLNFVCFLVGRLSCSGGFWRLPTHTEFGQENETELMSQTARGYALDLFLVARTAFAGTQQVRGAGT